MTIMNFWFVLFLDLAAIRKLLESESTAGTCPSCNMPFDKGKKRKLIDTCGHERCYSCMFRNEACPLCSAEDTSKLHFIFNFIGIITCTKIVTLKLSYSGVRLEEKKIRVILIQVFIALSLC